jgi:hypothetical protein
MGGINHVLRLGAMAIVLGYCGAAWGAEGERAEGPRRIYDSNYYEFEAPDASFVVWAPKGWAPSAAPTRPGTYLLRNPESLKPGAVPEVLMISIYPAQLDTEVTGIVDQTREAMAARYTDVKTLVDEKSVVGNGRGWKLVCDATDKAGVRLRAGMQMGVADSRIIIITFSAPPRRYDAVGALVDKAAATFRFLHPKVYERDGPTVHEDPVRGFRVTYPPGLRPSTKLERGIVLHLLAPIRGTQRHIRESMDLGTYPARGMTLQQAVEAFRQDVTNDGGRVLDVRDAKLGALAARRIICTQRGDLGDGKKFNAKFAIYVAARGDDIYFLYVRASDEGFDRFHEVAQKVIDSFEWIDAKDANR